MPTIQLTLCGPPAIRMPDLSPPVALPTKAMALVAYLAMEPGFHSREHLASLLWGESPDGKANASLRQALKTLREHLGDHVQIERTRVGLVSGVSCDARQFLELAKTSPASAAAIEAGRFLEGFAPRHCPDFDDWAVAVRRDLIARYGRVAAAAGAEAIARGDWRQAVTIGERWAMVAPDSPDAARLVVEANLLGAQPTPLAADDDRWQAVPSDFKAGLAGRAAVWETLVQGWERAAHGTPRVAVIEGEIGTGKTRLTDDFARWVSTQSGQVLRAQAYESERTTQLGLMLELLRGALACPGVAGADPIALGIIARVLPDVRRRFPSLAVHDGEPSFAILEEAAADVLIAIADDQPLLVAIDDFHWCDPESVAMLHYLVRRMDRASLLWYVALALGHEEHDAPALRVARALRTMPGAVRAELAPLAVEDVLEIIRDLGRVRADAVAHRLARRVHEITQGNPFYVVELLKTWLAEGCVTIDAATGEWLLSDREDADFQACAVPPSVHEAIAQRIGRLTREQQALLTTIAAHDHGCGADVLSHVHGQSRLRVAMVCDVLRQRCLVGEAEGRYVCAHPLIASVVLASVGAARRREVHRAIALATVEVARINRMPPDASEVAYHADRGEEAGLAYTHAMRAMEAARAVGANTEALHWLDVAARWAHTPEDLAMVDHATAQMLEAEAPSPG
jgi:DNA-binding SARP family transcriptional activator